MRAVIQRVSYARVTIGGEVRGEIGKGFLRAIPRLKPSIWRINAWGCASLPMRTIK